MSRGRVYEENAHNLRTDFQRDRDRILHCRAFRRLEYKTQVFLNGTGDHYRTRLTHTIEVAAISRTIARALRLNEDLAETIALAHDLGHPPFGHTGEYKLNEIMQKYGKEFDHNKHSLKIVDVLIEKYPGFSGLNLTWETRTGLIKHREPGRTALDGVLLPPIPSLESQVADAADDLTYYGHDIDDGLESGLLTLDDLGTLKIWQATEKYVSGFSIHKDSPKYSVFCVRCLIDSMVGDLVGNSYKNLESQNITTPEAFQNLNHRTITFSKDFEAKLSELKKFLYNNLYWNKKVTKINNTTAIKIEKLFYFYKKNPDKMGPYSRSRKGAGDIETIICDYIAGMTDRFALKEYKQIQ
jgi:dGTPase